MAESYGVDKSALSSFSSVFFYPYGVTQPFAGLLSDVFEPAFLIGVCQLIASIGAIICGASKSLGLGIFGRFLVGIGCGPTYVPICRFMMNWFPLKIYPILTGILLAIGGVGGIIAQGPLAQLVEVIDWRFAFYGIGIIGIVFSLLCLFIVRGHPTARGFLPVNPGLQTGFQDVTIKDRFRTLWENFKNVIKFPYFWLVSAYTFLTSGPYFDVNGLWASSYLTDCLGYTSTRAGTTDISLSIGVIVSSLTVPFISNLLKTRKWVLFGTCVLGTIACLVFCIVPDSLPEGAIWVLFIIFAMFTNAMTNVAYPFLREYFHVSIGATAVGCSNFFTFFSSAIYQEISTAIIGMYGHQPDGSGKYTVEGYRYGIWVLSTVSMAIGALVVAFCKDTLTGQQDADKGDEEGSSEEEEEVSSIIDVPNPPSGDELDEI